MNERKVVGSSYIINFYQIISELTGSYARYSNLLLEIKEKYGEEPDHKKIDEEELKILASHVQSVRFYAKMFYVQYRSICPAINVKEEKKLSDLYYKVKEIYIIPDSILEEFIIEINKLLLNEVIKDLLITSQNLVNQIYATNETEGETGESS